MANEERSGPAGGLSWPVRLATSIGVLIGASVALFVIRPLVGELPFLQGMLAFGAMCGVGGVLGRLVGNLLFPPSSEGPPEQPPHT